MAYYEATLTDEDGSTCKTFFFSAEDLSPDKVRSIINEFNLWIMDTYLSKIEAENVSSYENHNPKQDLEVTLLLAGGTSPGNYKITIESIQVLPI